MNARTVRLGEVSVGFLQALAAALVEHNRSPTPLLEQFGFDATRLGQAGATLSIARYMRLGHAAIQLSGIPALGLTMGRCARFAHAGLAGVTAAQAPNVREAARTLIRFEPLYGVNYRGQSSFQEDAGGAWLNFYSISPYNDFNRFVVDSVLSGWLGQLSLLTGEPLRAEQLQIEFPAPGYAQAYEGLSEAPVQFGSQANRLRLSQRTLALRNPDHCPSTWQQLLVLCEEALVRQTRSRSLTERIAGLLGPMLEGRREPDLGQVAARLKMPPWTLRRKLAEEGSGFRVILNQTRRDLAMAYIRDTELSLGEITYLLGFTSAEAFQRAFKRWAGQPPGAYRKNWRQPGEDPDS
ncbi:AraC family transcriptional regulator [Pseudomonas sp. DC3200b2]|uniref:AraC family transcriptional regulator n=1 Tax=Pseudomonas sp. DC3200b2 TaxID=2804669 RepID=UPI003CFB5B8A